MRDKNYNNKDWLGQKYIKEELSANQIGIICKVSKQVIQYWLIKCNIPRRDFSESVRLATSNNLIPSNNLLNILYGEILSDGNLSISKKHKNITSAIYQHGSQYKSYLKWLKDKFEEENLYCGRILEIKYNPKSFSTKNSYHLRTKAYPFLLKLYKQFYPNSKKIIPRNIDYNNHSIWLHYYLGDGSLHKKDYKGNPYIRLSSEGFSISDVEFLNKQLNDVGIKANTYKRRNSLNIRISAYSTKEFLNYIGRPKVECYQYKWALERR